MTTYANNQMIADKTYLPKIDQVNFKKARTVVTVGEIDGVPVECLTHCNNLSKNSSYYFLHRAQRSVKMASTASRLRTKLEAKKSASSR